jgi:hypothetical protein
MSGPRRERRGPRRERCGAWGTIDPEFDRVDPADDGYARDVVEFQVEHPGGVFTSQQYEIRRKIKTTRTEADDRFLPDEAPPGWADPNWSTRVGRSARR